MRCGIYNGVHLTIFSCSAGKMYWTDYLDNKIYRSDLSGENVETIVDSQLEVPGKYITQCTALVYNYGSLCMK